MSEDLVEISQAQFEHSQAQFKHNQPVMKPKDRPTEITKMEFEASFIPRPLKRLRMSHDVVPASDTQGDQPQSKFFTLPPEVRNRIYHFITPTVHVDVVEVMLQNCCSTCGYKGRPKMIDKLKFSLCTHDTEPKDYGTKAMSMRATGDYSGSPPTSFGQHFCCSNDQCLFAACQIAVCRQWRQEFEAYFWTHTTWAINLPALKTLSDKTPRLFSRMRAVELRSNPNDTTLRQFAGPYIYRFGDIQAVTLVLCLKSEVASLENENHEWLTRLRHRLVLNAFRQHIRWGMEKFTAVVVNGVQSSEELQWAANEVKAFVMELLV
ncbi:hypothetical protein B5807_06789 [Epicoccum nigrum]|uniref:Uncharacterized protein n=1 Tax=Epicoccum nigrum TaxID=105696 RepID=A0A1Y2LXQ2_EPING|nr:hypothetical protein B5807_06789 [Epicoccum nigrum]